ncbi:hypothetical protein ACWDZW_05015 [Streptomyces coeruleorubidus]|uniref:hypothetical protein n=1 Tax=Streptomyces coeruleorubidus TaxID=116188 RepID=UPI0034077307
MDRRHRTRHLAVGLGAAALTMTLTATTAPHSATTAAERYGWGDRLPAWSDEFGYGSEAGPAVPDRAKWRLAGGGPGKCWPGHSDNGRPYHPLLILWPDSNRHPEDGEYDYLENGAPGESCAEAFLHYPHPRDVPVQQEHARKCGVDLSQWHNVAVEWTPDHLRGFIDGEEWFRFSGGANADRDCIQCAPSMHQTIQLDNFHGDGLQSAVYEVNWARVYDLPDDEDVR